VDAPANRNFVEEIEDKTDFQVLGHALNFHGVCPECQKRHPSAPKDC
jgi:Fe2+ or Zn2+ uptake regulation protein